jgi:streptogramin lyase
MKELKEIHQQGMMSIEKEFKIGTTQDIDFGIQISEDGRVWICIDGVAFIRFKPKGKRK